MRRLENPPLVYYVARNHDQEYGGDSTGQQYKRLKFERQLVQTYVQRVEEMCVDLCHGLAGATPFSQPVCGRCRRETYTQKKQFEMARYQKDAAREKAATEIVKPHCVLLKDLGPYRTRG